MLPFLYNTAFLGILVAWFNKEKLETRVKLSNRSFWIISAIFSLISVTLNIMLVIYDLTDVDNALWTGSEAFVKGINPYTNKVVEHIDTEGNVFDSYYNYGPINLLVYSLFFLSFGAVFGKWWLFPSSIVLCAACYLIHGALKGLDGKMINIMPKQEQLSHSSVWDHQRDLPLFCMLLSPFLMNNSILMLLFFMIGRYCRYRGHRTAEVSFYVLGAEVKFMTGLIVAIMFLDQLRSRDFDLRSQLPFLGGISVFFLTALPFDVYAVVRGELLQQGVPSQRTGQIAGPLLIEILLFLDMSDLLIPTALIIFGACYCVTIPWSLSDREIILCMVSLFLLPFYGTELAIIPLVLMLFRYSGVADNKMSKSHTRYAKIYR